jgi:NitT/TauT family transport system ATP-binding protein
VSSQTASSVRIRNLKKSFPVIGDGASAATQVIGGVDLDVGEGEFVSFFGPNGCGKTTFLSLVAGMIPPDEGSVSIGSDKPSKAQVGIIFQNYREALYPWLRNIDNVAFPLELRGQGKLERRQQAAELLKYLGLDIPNDGYPYQLSGGQQQLLSIARALVFKADALVMDEPFASLDYSTRFFVRDRVQEIWMKTKTTTLLVSHSLEEAIYLADRLVLFSKKPMRVVEEIAIPLQRPRTASTLEQQEFFRIHAHALRVFKEEMLP